MQGQINTTRDEPTAPTNPQTISTLFIKQVGTKAIREIKSVNNTQTTVLTDISAILSDGAFPYFCIKEHLRTG